jgi:rod shape-determining protein MreC
VTTIRGAAWLSGLLAAALSLLVLSSLPQSAALEGGIAGFVTPAAGALRGAVRPVTDVLLHAGQLHELAAENAELRRQLERDEADLVALREQGMADAQARALIAAVGAEAGQFVTAAVVARDPAPGRDVLLINRGEREGVRPGQPVLGAGATLVGVVAQVEGGRARVRLLTDRDSAITAIVQASRTPASLAGTGRGMRLVAHGAPVAAGDVVLSSALGGLLPPGLLAGKVTRVTSAPQDLVETIEVEPLSDFARLEQVLVMTDFRPGAALPSAAGTAGTSP